VATYDYTSYDGESCTSPKHLYRLKDNLPIEIVVPCHSRFESLCPFCAKRWQRKVRSKVREAVLSMTNPIFLTLTLQYNKKTLDGSVLRRKKSLAQCRKELFRALRDKGYPIGAWVDVIEPPNHMHLAIDSYYIPRDEIISLWKQITDGSWSVDIRRIKDPYEMGNYLAKYVSKPSVWMKYYDLEELKSFHIVQSWGLPPSSRVHPPKPWDGSEAIILEEFLARVDGTYSPPPPEPPPPPPPFDSHRLPYSRKKRSLCLGSPLPSSPAWDTRRCMAHIRDIMSL
jgi:REP element-mobilizing transposase RayT